MSTFEVSAGIIRVTFQQMNNPGAISIPGLKVGDVVLAMVIASVFTPANVTSSSSFEPVVTVDDELQQTTSFAGSPIPTYMALLYRGQ